MTILFIKDTFLYVLTLCQSDSKKALITTYGWIMLKPIGKLNYFLILTINS